MKIRSAAFNKALNDELVARQRRIRQLRRKREAEVYAAIPEIQEFDSRLRAQAIELGKKVIKSNTPDTVSAEANEYIDKMLSERAALLQRAGFSADYLEPDYICRDCRDTGRIGTELCHCVTQLAVNIAFEDSGLNPAQSFANFDLSLQRSQKNRNAMSKILDAARAYADGFPGGDRRDMLYFGSPGVGKTYLLNCIGARVLERGYSVLKLNAHKLIQLTMDNLRSSPDSRPDFTLPELLIIDDLGAEPMIRNITIETLLSLISERQDMNKATLFATNLDIASDDPSTATLQTVYGERLASRLMSPVCVKIQAVRTDNVRLLGDK